MARQNHGPLSRAKGKLGGVVYQQYEGMQISREYQPVVKNPQTENQTKNRAEFKLASQTVALYKEVINARLGKLSIYTRTRRGAALEAIKRIITNPQDNEFQLEFADAVSAINAKSLTEYAAPTVTTTAGKFSVTAPAETVIIGVIVGFDTEGGFVGRKVVVGAGSASARDFTFPAEYKTAKAMFVYTVATEEAGRAIYDNIEDPDTAFRLDVARLVSTGDIDISDIAGSIGSNS